MQWIHLLTVKTWEPSWCELHAFGARMERMLEQWGIQRAHLKIERWGIQCWSNRCSCPLSELSQGRKRPGRMRWHSMPEQWMLVAWKVRCRKIKRRLGQQCGIQCSCLEDKEITGWCGRVSAKRGELKVGTRSRSCSNEREMDKKRQRGISALIYSRWSVIHFGIATAWRRCWKMCQISVFQMYKASLELVSMARCSGQFWYPSW